ncbi:major facilitator superfamily domain-containing protein [Clohesyomyces aquaticus]|uniref:Major facilitator superfamily domain-containing protein n=1 Tax=Clohesyomyces aquaticus TaxID=1231657 RepID=A0A1Y1ZUG1_9PLEO|nr:major facilitator superfamily domain-containing protein [Clohesyomyces aquaticus]
MAFLLYKYIKRRINEKKSPTSADDHLVPEIALGPVQTPNGLSAESLHVTGANEHENVATTNKTPTPPAEEIARIKEEASRIRKYRWKMIAGLFIPTFLATIDFTIVAPAVPIISSHFNRLSGSFNWIVASFTLTYTTFVPISGQIADVYGRHSALQFHLFWLLIGSIICAAATTWPMLLLGRALQGLGSSGIMNLSRIIMSDNMSLADNSKNNTIFSVLIGISYAIGPVVGGYLASANWRYCFVVSVPLAVLSHLIVFFLMRKDLVHGRVASQRGSNMKRLGFISGLATFDWPGISLFIFGIGLFILAIMWAGTQFAWSSAAVIAPLTLGAILSILFFWHEFLLEPGRLSARIFPRQIAMMPFELYKKKDTLLLLIINFATGISLTSAFYFISIYWELAEGYSASDAGVQLLYYTPGLGVGAYSAMFMCNVAPRQTFYPLALGSVLECLGMALLAWAVRIRHRSLVKGMLALAGAGTGLRFMPVVLHAAGIWQTRLAAILSLLSFAIPFGETIGISMMGSVFTNRFNAFLKALNRDGQTHFTASGPPNLGIFDGLPKEVKVLVQDRAAKAVMWAFVSILPFMAMAVVASFALGNVWIGRPAEREKNGVVKKEEVKGSVLYTYFVWAALTGRVGEQKSEVWRAEEGEADQVVERKAEGRTEWNGPWV